jgi:phosphoribosyl-dephospho-CoA transferase
MNSGFKQLIHEIKRAALDIEAGNDLSRLWQLLDVFEQF